MVCEWLKNGQGQWKRTRFYLSWNYSCTLYLLAKIKLKNHLTSACLNLNYGTKKNVKVRKMVEFIKTCNHYPRKFNFGHFFSSIIRRPQFCSEKNTKKQQQGRVLIAYMSKNEQIQFFDSQMDFPVILISWIWNFPQPWCDIQVWEKIQEKFWRDIHRNT